ncbi:hypothetical protein M0R72_20205 [Candidatus Pacearchaeota archaeon]|nr:hypothetical protein [Candidatus Pacearchaeota archaeon]
MPGLKSTAYRVTKTNWTLFNGASAATLILTGTKPTVLFRLKITLSGTDCAGTVTVNSEVITFTQSATKTTTTNLTALPTITTANLSCTVKVECIDMGGAPIVSETKTAFLCRWMDTTRSYIDSTGTWTQSLAEVLTADTLCVVGSEIEYLSVRYTIAKVTAFSKLSGREFLRRLYMNRGSI